MYKLSFVDSYTHVSAMSGKCRYKKPSVMMMMMMMMMMMLMMPLLLGSTIRISDIGLTFCVLPHGS